ncbi:MAG: non-canonical purine NTP pyrophosphatase [Phycisphaeraceae bacterium]|nr:non-canonical purine NTP pyrophosphatase [Phycisphaeraceae bacterium]
MPASQPIVIATGNPHKVEELRAILGGLGVPCIGLRELESTRSTTFIEPEEHGSTFETNAAIKALSYAQQTGLACLADDSGLEIDALGGRPGVISSHYCTDGRETGMTRAERDAANNARVLGELQGVPLERRGARFVCVMVLANPSGVLLCVRGTFEGRIGEPGEVPRGSHGFGYDPIFLVAPEYLQTSAELAQEDKNRLSHRGAAARALAAALEERSLRG